MTKEEALKVLLSDEIDTDLRQEIRETKEMLSLVLSAIVVSQKNAAIITGVSLGTIRNKVLRNELEVLSTDGSSLNYLTLKQINGLKPRRRPKTKRRN